MYEEKQGVGQAKVGESKDDEPNECYEHQFQIEVRFRLCHKESETLVSCHELADDRTDDRERDCLYQELADDLQEERKDS